MTNRRLGCLTPLGITAAMITLLVIGGAWLVQGGMMFSPGALNAVQGSAKGGVSSHAEIAGQCSACHTAPWDAADMNTRCLHCHEEIAASLDNPASLHGFLREDAMASAVSVAPSESIPLECRECHKEHHGPLGSLTTMQMVDFPHERTGYMLTGHPAHSDGTPFTCRDCHEDYEVPPTDAVCIDCHNQIDAAYTAGHSAIFGLNCLGCHDGEDRYGDTFDHNTLAFALTGKHAQATCAGCHQGMTTIAALRETPADCLTCHRTDDIHAGQMGTGCADCHSPEGWLPATFDHSKTAFPLIGEHGEVECAACHDNHVYKGTPTDCFSCHGDDDEHEGRFGTDCETCHSPEGWEPARFDHNRSAFQLTGAHIAVDCAACHVNDVFQGTPSTCVGCHAEPNEHAGQFGTDCAACHSTNAWKPAGYNGPHTFPMDHGDAASCSDCHVGSLTTWTCYTCHDQGEVIEEHDKEGIGDISNCLRCHPTGEEDEGGRDGGDDDD